MSIDDDDVKLNEESISRLVLRLPEVAKFTRNVLCMLWLGFSMLVNCGITCM